MRKVLSIACLTFQEAVRAKFFGLLLAMSLVLVLLAGFFQNFDFGGAGIKFIVDFGFAAVVLLGGLLTLVMTAQGVYNELENRTAAAILSKPVYRWQYLLGKAIGVQALLLVFCAATGCILAGLLGWEEHLQAMENTGAKLATPVRQSEVFLFMGIQWLKFSVITTLTLAVTCLSQSSLYAMFVSFLAVLACQLQYLAAELYKGVESKAGLAVAWFLKTAVPNFQAYNLGDQLVISTTALPEGILADLLAYSTVWYFVFLGLAVMFFSGREV
jgi:ABC-2 type transport system permease protein